MTRDLHSEATLGMKFSRHCRVCVAFKQHSPPNPSPTRFVRGTLSHSQFVRLQLIGCVPACSRATASPHGFPSLSHSSHSSISPLEHKPHPQPWSPVQLSPLSPRSVMPYESDARPVGRADLPEPRSRRLAKLGKPQAPTTRRRLASPRRSTPMRRSRTAEFVKRC
jgi:hypothetical protein